MLYKLITPTIVETPCEDTMKGPCTTDAAQEAGDLLRKIKEALLRRQHLWDTHIELTPILRLVTTLASAYPRVAVNLRDVPLPYSGGAYPDGTRLTLRLLELGHNVRQPFSARAWGVVMLCTSLAGGPQVLGAVTVDIRDGVLHCGANDVLTTRQDKTDHPSVPLTPPPGSSLEDASFVCPDTPVPAYMQGLHLLTTAGVTRNPARGCKRESIWVALHRVLFGHDDFIWLPAGDYRASELQLAEALLIPRSMQLFRLTDDPAPGGPVLVRVRPSADQVQVQLATPGVILPQAWVDSLRVQ